MTETSSPRARLFSGILLLTVVVLAYAVWRQHGELQALKAVPTATPSTPINEAAATPLAPPPAATPTETTEPSSVPVAETPAQPATPAAVLELTPTGKMAPRPRLDGLALAGTHVVPAEGGLRATMKFTPTVSDPLGIIDVVVRLPRDQEARILGLDAIGEARFSDVAQRVSEDGKFALFHGQLESGATVEFALTVSGEAVADVRGTAGIGPFDMVIGPNGTTTRPK